MNSNVAAFALEALRRFESDRFGSTTLGVLDDSASRFAGMVFLADSFIWHLVMAFDVGIHIRRDLILVDRHIVLAITSNRWLIVEIRGDALRLKFSFRQKVPLAERVGAGPFREFVASITVERANG